MFELDESTSLWSLFVSAFISSTLLPGGSEALLLYLSSQANANMANLWLVATLGNSLGGIVTFGMGWWLARRFPGKALDEQKHKRAVDQIRRYGSVTLLFSWLPIVGDPLCFVAGWLKMPWIVAGLFIAAGKAARYAVLLIFI